MFSKIIITKLPYQAQAYSDCSPTSKLCSYDLPSYIVLKSKTSLMHDSISTK